MAQARLPPHYSKWALMKLRGDDTDVNRVAIFNFNEQVLEAMEPVVNAAFAAATVRQIYMINGVRHCFVDGSDAARLVELHIETQRAASHANEADQVLPDWRTVMTHMRGLLAGATYQSRRKEQLYAHPQYDATKHGSLFKYFSALAEKAQDARLFGRDLAELFLSKGGDAQRVHLQSILDQPTVNHDVGKFLVQLQREMPERTVKFCEFHGDNTSHDTAHCRGKRREQRQSKPYNNNRRNNGNGNGNGGNNQQAPAAPPTFGCPPDMQDRKHCCWICGLPGHPRRNCQKAEAIRTAADPAVLRNQYKADWIAAGRDFVPRRATAIAAVHAVPAPSVVPDPATPAVVPPVMPPRPERLGGPAATTPRPAHLAGTARTVITAPNTIAPVTHEGMDVDDGATTGRPLVIAMSDLFISAKQTRSKK